MAIITTIIIISRDHVDKDCRILSGILKDKIRKKANRAQIV